MMNMIMNILKGSNISDIVNLVVYVDVRPSQIPGKHVRQK